MIEWQDDGILLAARPYGETSALLDIFTKTHGRVRGMVRGFSKNKGNLQPGNQVNISWSARSPSQLGSWKIEFLHGHANMDAPELLWQLKSITTLLAMLLPQGVSYPLLYCHLKEGDPEDPLYYLNFELIFLQDLGFGLALEVCAVTGQKEGLFYVSPKTGHAVIEEVGRPYAHHLLVLPSFLVNHSPPTRDELVQSFLLTDFFLDKHFGDTPRYKNWKLMRQYYLKTVGLAE